jgi:hypothetical protein
MKSFAGGGGGAALYDGHQQAQGLAEMIELAIFGRCVDRQDPAHNG